MDDLNRFMLGLLMITAVIVIGLGLIMSHNSYLQPTWYGTGRKISLLGAVLLAASIIIYGAAL